MSTLCRSVCRLFGVLTLSIVLSMSLSGCEQMQPMMDMFGASSGPSSEASASSSETSVSAEASVSTPGVSASAPAASVEAEEALLASNPSFIGFNFMSATFSPDAEGLKVATFGSPDGAWQVTEDPAAPTPPYVLSQTDGATGNRWTGVYKTDLPYAKFDVRTRVKIDPSGATQAAGLFLMARDAGNGYAVLLDAAKGEVRLDRVVRGMPQKIGSQKGILSATRSLKITSGRWYAVRANVYADGDRCNIVVYVDGIKALEHRDNVFLSLGWNGVVTRNDTRASFDGIGFSEERKPEIVAAPTPEPTPKPGAKPPKVEEEKPSRCAAEHKYKFDNDTAGQQPKGFENIVTGGTQLGAWPVVVSDSARSKPHSVEGSNALKQKGIFNLLILKEHAYTNFEAQVDLRIRDGDKDHSMAGLVIRYHDADNYYLAGINYDEDQIVLIRVANGERQNIRTVKRDLKMSDWYELKVTAVDMDITVELNGSTIIRAQDNTFLDGEVGFFSRSNAKAQFDDLKICALVPPLR